MVDKEIPETYEKRLEVIATVMTATRAASVPDDKVYVDPLAMQAGLDSAILDPLDRELQAAILTTELLLGKDNHCLNYVRASRKGIFD